MKWTLRETNAAILIAATRLLLICSLLAPPASAQMGSAAEPRAAAPAHPANATATHLPQLVDITSATVITFEHHSSPEQRYVVESISVQKVFSLEVPVSR